MTQPRPATVRVYFDACVLGLAHLLCQVRADFTYPGDPGGRVKRLQRPACPITLTDTKDVEWIPMVAQRQWLIITRDRHIQRRLPELEAVRTHGAKVVNFMSPDAGDTWKQLETFTWGIHREPMIMGFWGVGAWKGAPDLGKC